MTRIIVPFDRLTFRRSARKKKTAPCQTNGLVSFTGPRLMDWMNWWRPFPPRPERCRRSIAIVAGIYGPLDWQWRLVVRNATLKNVAVTRVGYCLRKRVRHPKWRGTLITLSVGM